MMPRIVLAGLLSATSAAALWAADPSPPARSSATPARPSRPDRSYGTAVQWEPDMRTAVKKADRDRKLLLVLAVAGHFEDPFFT